jgi:uncharacterized membrane protein
MTEAEKPYGLLSETSTIAETRNPARQRNLPPQAAFDWLREGWHDFMIQPGLSLTYGVVVFLVTAFLWWTLVASGWDFVLLPAIAGYMIVAPILAMGLYEKSRALEEGERPTLGSMLLVRPRAGAQVFFTGLLLCLLMLLWMRAAVIIYALFFGVRPFPGFESVPSMLVTTLTGWAMLLVGIVVGGLFAAFAFAVSVFSIPMLLDRRTDALTAMGTSVAMVWNNFTPMIAWGAIVLALFVVSVVTGFIGFIVIFPLLGHATWHAYRAMS